MAPLRAALPVALAAGALVARQCLGLRQADALAAWRGLPAGAAAGRRAGGGDDPRRLPARRLAPVRLRRAPADGQRRLPLWTARARPTARPNGTPIPMGGDAPRARGRRDHRGARCANARPRSPPPWRATRSRRRGMFAVGDTLGNRHLAASARRAIAVMPAARTRRLRRGRADARRVAGAGRAVPAAASPVLLPTPGAGCWRRWRWRCGAATGRGPAWWLGCCWRSR